MVMVSGKKTVVFFLSWMRGKRGLRYGALLLSSCYILMFRVECLCGVFVSSAPADDVRSKRTSMLGVTKY